MPYVLGSVGVHRPLPGSLAVPSSQRVVLRARSIDASGGFPASSRSVIARHLRLFTAIEAVSGTWLSTPFAAWKRCTQNPMSPASWVGVDPVNRCASRPCRDADFGCRATRIRNEVKWRSNHPLRPIIFSELTQTNSSIVPCLSTNISKGRFGRTIAIYLLSLRGKRMNVTRGSDGNSTAVRLCPAIGTDIIWRIDLDRGLVATEG